MILSLIMQTEAEESEQRPHRNNDLLSSAYDERNNQERGQKARWKRHSHVMEDVMKPSLEIGADWRADLEQESIFYF